MVRPQQLLESVLYTLQQSEELPSSISFVGYEPDINSEPIDLPMIEVSMGTQIRISEANSDLVGYVTDDSNNRIGRKYDLLYTLELDVAIWTAQGSKYSPRRLSDIVRSELYKHENSGPHEPLRSPETDNTLDDVWRFVILDGTRTDDLTTSPTLRRREHQVSVSANERYVAMGDEPPIAAFNQETTVQ